MENWLPVVGYEGYYEVSDKGNVRSVPRFDGCHVHKKYHTLAQRDNGHGYKIVNLWKDNKGKFFYVHRLVAEVFIPNPSNLPQVNHIDENKANNCVENLEWCNNSYNNRYGTKGKRQSESYLNSGKNCYKIIKCDMDGNKIATYRSVREAGRENGISPSLIFQYLRCGYSQCKGYTWRRVNSST